MREGCRKTHSLLNHRMSSNCQFFSPSISFSVSSYLVAFSSEPFLLFFPKQPLHHASLVRCLSFWLPLRLRKLFCERVLRKGTWVLLRSFGSLLVRFLLSEKVCEVFSVHTTTLLRQPFPSCKFFQMQSASPFPLLVSLEDQGTAS